MAGTFNYVMYVYECVCVCTCEVSTHWHINYWYHTFSNYHNTGSSS